MYHCSIKTITRSGGRSAPAAAAYRSCSAITDQRLGTTYDYTKKQSFAGEVLIGIEDREVFWNTAEAAEKRSDSVTAREIEISLPASLPEEKRRQMVYDFAAHLHDTYDVAVDACIHRPHGRSSENHHAHIMISARPILPDGSFAVKKDRRWNGPEGSITIEAIREKWSQICVSATNDPETYDHRSFARRGITERPPTPYLPRQKWVSRPPVPPLTRTQKTDEQLTSRIVNAINRIKCHRDRRRESRLAGRSGTRASVGYSTDSHRPQSDRLDPGRSGLEGDASPSLGGTPDSPPSSTRPCVLSVTHLHPLPAERQSEPKKPSGFWDRVKSLWGSAAESPPPVAIPDPPAPAPAPPAIPVPPPEKTLDEILATRRKLAEDIAAKWGAKKPEETPRAPGAAGVTSTPTVPIAPEEQPDPARKTRPWRVAPTAEERVEAKKKMSEGNARIEKNLAALERTINESDPDQGISR